MRMALKIKPVAAGLLSAFSVWHGLALAGPGDDRITSFILSSGGLAQIERQVHVAEQASVNLPIPLDQVDDVLKSLVVRDPAGHVTSMVLDGEAPVQEAFARLPFGPDALVSPARLAAALQGQPVRASSNGRTVQGRVLGVAFAEQEEKGGEVLSVMTQEGQIQTLRMGADTLLEIMDDALRSRLQAALQASGQRQADTLRTLELGLSGKGARDVTLNYVVAAPVWKSAYRLSTGKDGKARLQAWAVLENASGQDWKDVKVTLVSGAPVTLSQRLFQRYWHARPELPVAVGATAAPQADTSAMLEAMPSAMNAKAVAAADARMRMAAQQRGAGMMLSAPAPMPEPQELAAVQEGQVDVRYELPKPVSAAAGQTVSVPFIDTEVPAEQVSVFQPQRGSLHPVAAVWLKNATSGSLPPGILTVYDGRSGHAGDAQLASIPVGESRFVYFAEDGKVEVRSEHKPQETLSELSISQGVLRAQRTLTNETLYTVKGASDGERTVIIEHPRRAGWKFESKELTGETASHYRLRVSVPAGKSLVVRALMTRQEPQTLALSNTDEKTLAVWHTNASDERVRRDLQRLIDLHRALAGARQQEHELDEALKGRVLDQKRIRDNLAAVPAESELGKRYLQMLEKEEADYADLNQRRNAARQEVATHRKALEEALAAR